MALRHAVLVALLDGERSGYELTKTFEVGVSNFWFAAPQQVYAELSKLEAAGLVAGREVVQQGRPNKRIFVVTDAGMQALTAFAATPSKPLAIRDDLVVKIHAADILDPEPLIAQLTERAEEAAAKLVLFEKILAKMRGGLDEASFLARGERVGPYLTTLGGCALQRAFHEWCLRTIQTLGRRAEAERPPP